MFQDLQSTWAGLNRLAADDRDPMLKRIRRDGHCHEAVMWYVSTLGNIWKVHYPSLWLWISKCIYYIQFLHTTDHIKMK